MVTLVEKLRADRVAAMKAGDTIRKNVLSLVLSGISTVEKQGKTARVFTDEETLAFLATEIKKRRETAKTYQVAGVLNRAEQETTEADILATYLPVQLTETEITTIVKQVIADTPGGNLGAVMGKVMGQVKGKADGAVVRQIVQQNL